MECTTSIIVSTYNRPDALRLVLLALEEQNNRDFEVIIADDGSTTDTRLMIESLRPRLDYPLYHIWQADDGFRAAAARNKAVVVSQGKYLIFLDGDCLPLNSFVRNHLHLIEAQCFVVGNRVLLKEYFTQNVLAGSEPIYNWNSIDWLLARCHGRCNRFLPFIKFPLPRKLRQKWEGVKTCNLGMFKAEFLAVNGFDERYCGWGYEDSDLVIRLLKYGIKRKDGHGAIPVVHLWHAENNRTRERINYQQLQDMQRSSRVKAEQGIDQYYK